MDDDDDNDNDNNNNSSSSSISRDKISFFKEFLESKLNFNSFNTYLLSN